MSEVKRFSMEPEDNETIMQYYNLLYSYSDLNRPTAKFEELRGKYINIEKELYYTMSPEQGKLFRDYDAAAEKMYSVLCQEMFLMGFKAAMRLATESFK